MMDQKKIIAETATAAGAAQVVDYVEDGLPTRYLMVKGTVQSGKYREQSRTYDLLFPYLDGILWSLYRFPQTKSVYLIGGGSFAFARAFLHEFREQTITVSEYDEKIVELAREYFDLADTEKEAGDRLKIVIGDGFSWLKESGQKFDVIINDAFTAGRSVGRNSADTKMIKEHLNENGVYITNVAAAAAGVHAFCGRRYRDILYKHFAYVHMVIAEEDRDPREKQNILAYASDREV